MKKHESLEQNRVRQPGAGGVGKKSAPKPPGAKAVKLSPPRQGEPAGLLEEECKGSEAYAVTFEYFNPDAREVLVAGSFNGWQPTATPMSRQRGGKWFSQVLLPPGHYEYRFVVDGKWQDDPMAAHFVANAFGGLNCVIEVKTMAAGASQRT
jgi:5'-AMP-activated protein kinase regulatory beta subunit